MRFDEMDLRTYREFSNIVIVDKTSKMDDKLYNSNIYKPNIKRWVLIFHGYKLNIWYDRFNMMTHGNSLPKIEIMLTEKPMMCKTTLIYQDTHNHKIQFLRQDDNTKHIQKIIEFIKDFLNRVNDELRDYPQRFI